MPCRVIIQVDILCCAFKLSGENGVSYEGVGFVNVEQGVAITLWCLATPYEYRTVALIFSV